MTIQDLSVIDNTKILTSNRKKSRKLLFQELYSLSINNNVYFYLE